MKLFEIKNLNYAYNNELVLKNINLSYDNEHFLAITGPNGGGKSTLIKLILGLLPSKSCHFNALLPEQIGYVPQNTSLNENFPISALELVLMGLINTKSLGFYSKKDKEQALKTLELVGIKDLAHKSLNELSGGQKQRAFIARALVSPCKLLILDEPTASLDTQNALQIFKLLNALHQKGIGIIIICHDINLVLAYADNIAYLNKELILHQNNKEKLAFIEHLEQNHQHFCEVELSLKTCECELKNA